MKNGAFAPKEQMLHFPRVSKGVIMELRVKSALKKNYE